MISDRTFNRAAVAGYVLAIGFTIAATLLAIADVLYWVG